MVILDCLIFVVKTVVIIFAITKKMVPGILKRMYVDRIHQGNIGSKNLICSKCKQLLGIKYVYEKEKRPAYRLFVGAIVKKIVKLH